MKRTMKYITYVCAALLAVACHSCSDEIVNQPEPTADGTLLNLYIGDIATPGTRLAELGNSDNISNGERPTNDVGNGEDKKNIGLYIYYEDDYKPNNPNAGDLTKPYVRNMECEVIGGRIVPKGGSDVYIYDRMTIVAFYPYNSDPDDYTFKTKSDEKKYFITESDYSKQYYIPYRAQANVNPTNAYYVSLNLEPQQTVKIQVVLVSDDPDLFPDATTKTNGVVKLVPGIDSQNNEEGAAGDRRENWVDIVEQPYGEVPNPASSGSYVQRYTSYIWKNNNVGDPHHGGETNHNDNTFKKGDILLKSEKLTLFFPEDLNIREGNVYRYGYNLTTGEMFIPTSDNLIYDAKSLAASRGGGYQVCDINLEGVDWTPVNLTGIYDGGGHTVGGLTIDQNLTKSANVGLFGSVTGNSGLIKNLHLEKPVININFSDADPTETLNVGGLVGQINRALTEEEIQTLLASQLKIFKDLGLPQSVIDALLADLMKDYKGSGTSSIQGCKVSEPVITVTGDNVIVGGFAGTVGSDKNYKGNIKDSYVLGGSVKVNEGNGSYENVQVGAFAGLLNGGTITNNYTTTIAEGYVKPTDPATDPNDVAKGFANVVTPAPDGTGVSGSFTADLKGATEDGVKAFSSDWPGWSIYTGKWPVAHSTLGNSWGSMGNSATPTYPNLVWETPLNVK